MQEFVKKLIERLEERKQLHERMIAYESKNGTVTEEFQARKAVEVVEKAIEIVNQLAKEYNNDFCEWRLCDEEANVYDTTCRNPHILLEGSPSDNNYEFCPYCGKRIKVVE